MAEEIKIPVPWGHIAGKLCGNAGGPPVLCLHGLQDNAGTFDRLMKLLPKNFLYVALDLPGHGKSSHFQRGLPLTYMNYVYSVKLVADFYKWDKLILLAHSFGAQIAILFAAIYPNLCLKMIALDGLTPFTIKNSLIVRHFRKHFNDTQEVEQTLSSKEPPSHTYEEALDRFMNNRFSKLTRESAEILMQRSLIKTGDSFHFSTDQRLKKLFRFPFNLEHLETVVLSVKCPLFVIIAQETYNALKDQEFGAYLKKLDLIQELINLNYKVLEGFHDVHLDDAPLVAEHVTQFLLFQKSSL